MRRRLVAAIVISLALTSGCAYLAPRRGSGVSVSESGIVFRFFAPSARRVQLAGNWPGNNWARGDGSVGEADVGLMTETGGDGVWEITVELPPGRYEYLFWVDELTWYTDPANPEEVEAGPAGISSQFVVRRIGDRMEIR